MSTINRQVWREQKYRTDEELAKVLSERQSYSPEKKPSPWYQVSEGIKREKEFNTKMGNTPEFPWIERMENASRPEEANAKWTRLRMEAQEELAKQGRVQEVINKRTKGDAQTEDEFMTELEELNKEVEKAIARTNQAVTKYKEMTSEERWEKALKTQRNNASDKVINFNQHSEQQAGLVRQGMMGGDE